MIGKEEENGGVCAATANALLEWIGSFHSLLSAGDLPTKLEHLTDGVALAEVLHDVAPARFPRNVLSRPASTASSSSPPTPTTNWALALTNMKKLTRLLEAHYEEDLGLCLRGSEEMERVHAEKSSAGFDGFISYFSTLDLVGVVREKREREIVKIWELAIFAAVRAPTPEKARIYVEKIMALSPGAQAELKDCVERTLSRAGPSSRPSPSSSSSSSPSSLSNATWNGNPPSITAGLTSEAHPQEEGGNVRLKEKLQQLQTALALREEEVGRVRASEGEIKDELEGMKNRWKEAVDRADKLQKACEEWRVRVEEKEEEGEHWRREAGRWEAKVKAERERARKAEEGERKLADEVDVLRERAGTVQDLEGSLEKYKGRLEQMAGLKQLCRDLEERNATYLDQILQAEEGTKATVSSLKRALEQYKEKVVVLEREKFVAMERKEVVEGENDRLEAELEAAREGWRTVTEEYQECKRLLSRLQQQADRPEGGERDGGIRREKDRVGGLFEDAASVPERLQRLERENKQLRKDMEGRNQQPDGEGRSIISLEEDLALLRSEMQDVVRIKGEREKEAIAATKRAADLEAQILMLKGQCEEMEEEVGKAKEEGVLAVAAQESALARVRALVAETQDLEGQIATLKGEKDRLEGYTRKTLQAVQEKYVQTLGSLKRSNAEYKGKCQALEARLQEDRVAQKREEKLLMSAVYGLGMEMLQPEFNRVALAGKIRGSGTESNGPCGAQNELKTTGGNKGGERR